jgi:RNA polymerase sigma-70 factor (ECF subfamily)
MSRPSHAAEDLAVLTTRHVRGAVQGDEASLTWLIERFSPWLRLQAEYRLGRTMVARVSPDDVVQEAWLAVLPKLGDLVAREGRLTPVLLSYLSKTICGRAINLLRSHLTQAAREQTPTGRTNSGSLGEDQILALTRTSSARARASELARSLTRALHELAEGEREVLVLRLVEGLSNAEAAEELGDLPNTVAQRYHRALFALRQRLPPALVEEFAGVSA